MLKRIDIGNYKSITKLPIELGRFNVFIGENGAGKSNILEAIALASAAANEKLDNEFLAARGVRVARPELMRAGFTGTTHATPITISIAHENGEQVELQLQNDNQPYSRWNSNIAPSKEHFRSSIRARLAEDVGRAPGDVAEVLGLLFSKWEYLLDRPEASLNVGVRDSSSEAELFELFQTAIIRNSFLLGPFKDFLIYSPENSALRTFDREGQIEPLGINGEGLLKLIHVHAAMEDSTVLDEIREALKMLGWFEDFKPSTEVTDERLIIRDRYLEKLPFDLDQKSANEGFLFLLFYFALFTSKLTPQFFAIDNIDASLNPKLCQKLTTELVRLSKANDKQVIVTTHNPAVLDGLNLDDDEQRLFVVSRGRDGATKLKRVQKPASDGPSYRLSELFLRGLLGGLPKGF
jgi:predicted ATPase